MLNIPPDQRGLIHEKDIESLVAWRKLINSTFAKEKNIAKLAKISHKGALNNLQKSNYLIDNRPNTYWAAGNDSCQITLTWNSPQSIKFVELAEYIAEGQRVEKFEIEALVKDTWMQISQSTTIGYKRIIKVDASEVQKLRLKISQSLAPAVLAEIKVFK